MNTVFTPRKLATLSVALAHGQAVRLELSTGRDYLGTVLFYEVLGICLESQQHHPTFFPWTSILSIEILIS